MNALLLLLLDSRSPAGGHNHSGGMEPAISSGTVRDLDDVEAFCRGRLRTSGRVNAAFAAAACRLALAAAVDDLPAADASTGAPRRKINSSDGSDAWDELDAELDARTPSEAVRAASRQLGRGLMRLVRATLPGFPAPWSTASPHHPIVLGAAVAWAGGDPELAARAAALATISVPTSGAVRLLGLDPFAAHSVLARLAPDVDALATETAATAAATADPTCLPSHSAPALDLLADFHLTAEVRLFAS